jgi:hypothetical protein
MTHPLITDDVVVLCFPNGTALIDDVDSKDQPASIWAPYERELTRRERPDKFHLNDGSNHCVYRLAAEDMKPIFIQFCDDRVSLGRSIRLHPNGY